MRSFIVLNYSRAFADADVSSTLLTNGILWVYSTFYKRYFLSPTARKKDVVVVFFKRAFSKTLFVSLSLVLSRSLSLSTTTLFRRRLSLFNQSSHADVSSLKSFLESSSLAKPPSISSFGNSICFASRSASSLPLCESASR